LFKAAREALTTAASPDWMRLNSKCSVKGAQIIQCRQGGADDCRVARLDEAQQSCGRPAGAHHCRRRRMLRRRAIPPLHSGRHKYSDSALHVYKDTPRMSPSHIQHLTPLDHLAATSPAPCHPCRNRVSAARLQLLQLLRQEGAWMPRGRTASRPIGGHVSQHVRRRQHHRRVCHGTDQHSQATRWHRGTADPVGSHTVEHGSTTAGSVAAHFSALAAAQELRQKLQMRGQPDQCSINRHSQLVNLCWFPVVCKKGNIRIQSPSNRAAAAKQDTTPRSQELKCGRSHTVTTTTHQIGVWA